MTSPTPGKVLAVIVLVWSAWIAFGALRDRYGSRSASAPILAVPTQSKPDRVVAYYFHVTARCSMCRMIQSYTEEALTTGLSDALETGDLEWRPINIQRPENRHFVQDYQLYARSVVVARVRAGRQVEWKCLEEIWDVLESKPAFISYVQRHIREYLKKP